MKKTTDPKGRYFSIRHSPRSGLLLSLIFSTLASLVIPALGFCLIVWGCLTFNSCEKETQDSDIPDVKPLPDSTLLVLSYKPLINSGYQGRIESMEWFVYSASGLQELQAYHITKSEDRSTEGIPPPDTVKVAAGEKIIVGIANRPEARSTDYCLRYDSVQQLAISYYSEVPSSPILTGEADCWGPPDSGIGLTDTSHVRVNLTPMLACVRISKITNEMSGYRRLEDPRIRLRNVCKHMEVLKTSGFYPTEVVSDTTGHKGLIWERLPFDVGMYPQQPGTTVWCYPNEDTGRATVLELEFETAGNTYLLQKALGPIGRNSTIDVDIVVREPDDYDIICR